MAYILQCDNCGKNLRAEFFDDASAGWYHVEEYFKEEDEDGGGVDSKEVDMCSRECLLEYFAGKDLKLEGCG